MGGQVIRHRVEVRQIAREICTIRIGPRSVAANMLHRVQERYRFWIQDIMVSDHSRTIPPDLEGHDVAAFRARWV
jgi:hypothetical protein